MKKEQLGQLILASEDTMYRVAKTLLRSDADCADAIQEAIVKAFSSLHTLRRDSYAKTWLVRIVINECYTIMRKEKRVVSIEDYVPEEEAESARDYWICTRRSAGFRRNSGYRGALLHGGVQRKRNCRADGDERECSQKQAGTGAGKVKAGVLTEVTV